METQVPVTSPVAASDIASRGDRVLLPARSQRRTSGINRLLEQRTWFRLRLLLDVLALSATAGLAMYFSSGATTRWLSGGFAVLTLVMLHARPSPDERMRGTTLDVLAHVAGVVSLSAVITMAAAALLGVSDPGWLGLRLAVYAGAYVGVGRGILVGARVKAMRSGKLGIPTLVMGAGIIGEILARRLLDDPVYGLQPVGFLDSDPLPRPETSPALPVPVLGGPDDLADAIQSSGANYVILAFSSVPDRVTVSAIRECQRLGVRVSLVPRLYEEINDRARLDHVGGIPLLALHPVDPRNWEFAIKHTIDRVVASLALILLAPLFLGIAIAVRVSSPGPVLFRQRRVGRDGRVFDVLKFRTMLEVVAPEWFEPPEGCAPGGVEEDDRRTPVGTWLRDRSLDELPQLINVLRGEMSLVGPRPERPRFVERFTAEIYRYPDRHRVKWESPAGPR